MAETKSTKMKFFGKCKNTLDEKISLKVSDLQVNPACMADVLTFGPDLNDRCASRSCNGNAAAPGLTISIAV